MKIHEMQEKRAAAIAAMRALADKAGAESRDLDADETRKFDEQKTAVEDLDKRILRAQTLADLERSAPAIPHRRTGDGAFEDRARDFSITKAVRAAIGDTVDAGLERELSAEVVRRTGRKFQGIAVPDQALHVRSRENRTLLAGSTASDLIATPVRGDLFIDTLRNALVTARLGATVLDGLVGDVDIPKQTGSSTAQWVGEDGSLTETDATFDEVQLRPKTVGAMTSISRRTLLNSVVSVEDLIRRDLAATIANAIDAQAMIGDGSGNTPTGIINTSGVQSTTLAGPTWAQVLEFVALVAGANADLEGLAWALNPHAVKKLRSTVRVSSTDSQFIMAEPGALAGYPAAQTNALPGGSGSPNFATVIFGAWSQLIVAYWSGVDILVNPYETTAYAKGRVLLRVMRDVDVKVRHGESFAFATDLNAG